MAELHNKLSSLRNVVKARRAYLNAMRYLTTVQQLEAIIKPIPAMSMKQLAELDDGCRQVLAQSPVAAFGFRDELGVPHTTLVGGQRGFVRVDSPTRITFALPSNSPEPKVGGGVSFVFLLPGVGETLRLNGSVLERAGGRVGIAVEEAFVHCAQCILRSGLWRPARGRRTQTPPRKEGAGPLHAAPIADFLAAAPFAMISSWEAAGSSDSSPRGDLPGFLQVLDGQTIAIPDRKGNHRTDTFHNLLSCSQLSLAAVVPGRDELLHVRGTAHVTDDPTLLSTMALAGKAPQLALIIRVEHAELVANEAVKTSNLWHSPTRTEGVPDLMGLAVQHGAQSKAKGLTGFLMRLLGKMLGGLVRKFPRLVRGPMNFAYRRGLTAEGYSIPEPDAQTSPLGTRPVRVLKVVRETADAVTLELESATPFNFRAGQYFTLFLEHEGERLRRAYSASSIPGGTRLSLTIKRVPGGRCSTLVNEKIKGGDRLELLGPSGSFCVDPAHRELVLLAGGSGITPLMSIARTMLASDADSRMALIYGNRAEGDVIFAEALARLRQEHGDRFVVRHVLERPSAGWMGGIGRLDEATLREELARLAPSSEAHFYVCGPEPMLLGARATLIGLGVALERIHEERFSQPRAPSAREVSRPFPMVVERRGEQVGAVEVPAGKSLLEAGLDAGLELPFSCAMGNCGECRVALRCGEVEMDGPNTLSAEERAKGFILTCVARALSPVTVELEPVERPSTSSG